MTGRAGMRSAAAVVLAAAFVAASAAPAAAQSAVPSMPAGEQPCIQPPTTTYEQEPWAQQILAPDQAWDLTRGAGVTVAVVDTGVDAEVPQLSAPGAVLPGASVIEGDSGPANDDCFGHGTFVAGIIAADPVPGTNFAGVAPDATILPVRVATGLEEETGDTFSPDALAEGIRRAVDLGADVVNVSASTSFPNEQLASVIRYAAERDVVVVASAANGAQEGDPVTYPASYPGVIAVGAVDVAGAHASFSQTGPFLSVVAPGVDVISLGPNGPGHWQGSGTSYAAPFVAGTAALIRSYYPHLTAPQIKQRLEITANHPPTQLPDPALGWGTVNVTAAVASVVNGEGSDGSIVVPRSPAAAYVEPPDEIGPMLATVFTIMAAVGIALAVLTVRLSTSGHRRGWQAARTMRVITKEKAPEAEQEQPEEPSEPAAGPALTP
ncbi:type VII secretion-associated serine protease mycosin [Saccharopolyspora sp. NFXS83]|uniref:type VII secretion-associated serine protease mycosin n=1 Tax=Saccharopolyspora sp. NFXS83 TaxID=2993560 RepID=UPI00224B8D01|nr:type VII secretion-associated serine protease mycosin [Saccharopolyspora sp. NFXS83]MCX2731492.1 type VII secretion-associated serine protease mycosin [Saccharopolyspora sp. NFXS83]